MVDLNNMKLKKVKTYIEDEYKIAYAKARKELGANLILIDKKEIKQGGFLGLFGKKKVKVTYGLEETPYRAYKGGSSESGNSTLKGANDELLKALKEAALKSTNTVETAHYDKQTGPTQDMFNIESEVKVNSFKPLYDTKPSKESEVVNSGVYSPFSNNFKTSEDIKKELQKTSEINVVTGKNSSELSKIKEEIKRELDKELEKEKIREEYSGKTVDFESEEFIDKLRDNDIPKELALEINAYFERKGFSKTTFKEGLANYFSDNVKTIKNEINKKFLMLIGPTGVGKTTSCAKIVANNWREERDVAFITADTYRLEAVSQLKAYANIMRVPVEIIKKPEDIQVAITKFKDKDLVLMDTAGRSPKNSEQMEELKSYIQDQGSEIEIALVLSATSKLKVLYETIEKFKYIGFSSIIFTKIDETSSVGSLITIIKKYDVPISFITTGQTVPDDIEIATKDRLKEIFIEGIN